MAKRLNGTAKWVIVAIAVGGLIFNSGILYNDVKHLRQGLIEVKQEIHELRTLIINQ
jgi:cell division protein FtsL